MLWCRGAQNIELSNDKRESALKCTVSSQCTPFLDVQTDKQTDELHGNSATIPSTHNHTANGTQPNFARGEEVNRADASRIRWRLIVNVIETIEIRCSVSRGPKNHFKLAMASRRAAFSGNTLCLKKRKNDNDVAHYNLNAYQPILITFGRDVADRVCYKMVT